MNTLRHLCIAILVVNKLVVEADDDYDVRMSKSDEDDRAFTEYKTVDATPDLQRETSGDETYFIFEFENGTVVIRQNVQLMDTYGNIITQRHSDERTKFAPRARNVYKPEPKVNVGTGKQAKSTLVKPASIASEPEMAPDGPQLLPYTKPPASRSIAEEGVEQPYSTYGNIFASLRPEYYQNAAQTPLGQYSSRAVWGPHTNVRYHSCCKRYLGTGRTIVGSLSPSARASDGPAWYRP